MSPALDMPIAISANFLRLLINIAVWHIADIERDVRFYNRREPARRRGRTEAVGAAARGGAFGHHPRALDQSDQSQCDEPVQNAAGGSCQAWSATSHAQRR